jgi:predicted porin
MGNNTAMLLLAAVGAIASGTASAQDSVGGQTQDAQIARIQARMEAMEQEMGAMQAEREQMRQELQALRSERRDAAAAPVAGVAAVSTPATPASAPAAVAAAPAAPAEPPAVEVYGILDVFLSSGDYGNGTVTRLDSSGARGSRVGFRGGKVLNDDVTLEYNLEAGFNVDSGSMPDPGRIFNRQSYVGLKTRYGTVRFGRMNTMQFVMLGKYDAMDATTQASALLNLAPFVPRYSNVVAYISPKLADAITLQAQYGLGEASDGSDKNANWHVSAEYEKGPVGFGLTHEEIKDATGTITTRYTLVGGSYDFGRFRLFGGYHTADVSNGTRDADTWSVSGLYRMTPTDWISLGYGALSDNTGNGNNANEIGLLYQKFLGKNTVIYAALSKVNNHNLASFTLNGSAVAGEPVAYPGADPQAAQLGLRYSF